MRRLALFLIILATLLAVMPVSAQTAWHAYLLNTSTNTLYRIDQAGTQTSFALDLGGRYIASAPMSFDHTDSRVAFCTQTMGDGVNPATSYLVIYDFATQTNVIDIELGTPISCRVGLFSPEDNLITVALVNEIPMIDPTADTDRPDWQLLVLDTQTGAVVHELNADTPAFATLNPYPEMGLLAEVRFFTGEVVVFGALPFPGEFVNDMPTFSWSLADGTLGAVPQWGKPGLAMLRESNEMAWVDVDLNLPMGTPPGPVPVNNIVKFSDAMGNQRTIFHHPTDIPVQTRFINNGQGLAIQMIPEYDETQPQPNYWLLLDRAGNTQRINESFYPAQVENAPDGYVAFEQTSDGAGTAASRLIYDTGAQQVELWAETYSGDLGLWQLVGVTPIATEGNLAPFVEYIGS